YDIVGALPAALSNLQIDHANGRLTLASTNPADVRDYTIQLRATDAEGKSVTNTVTIHLLNTAPTYVGGLASNYDGWPRNPKTVLVPYSVFSDINGPFTL